MPQYGCADSSTEQAPLLKWLGVTYGMPKAEYRPHAAAIVALLFAACHTGLAKKQPKLVASRAGQQSIGDAEICGGIRRCDLVAVRKSQVSEQRRRDLVVMTVGLALFNDVLLLLMLVPMLPALG